MSKDEAYQAVEAQLKRLSVRDEVQVGVLGRLKADKILLKILRSLEKGECVYAETVIDPSRISVRIGPRDWSFNGKGEFLGCGTIL